MDLPRSSRLRTTVRHDAWRALFNGPLGAVSSLALVVTVQHHLAGPQAKATLTSAPALGHLAAPFTLLLFALLATGAAQAQAWMLLAAAACLALAGLGDAPWLLVGGVAAAVTLNNATLPFVMGYWRQNAPETSRGRWFATTVRWEVAGGLAATGLTAWWVGADAGRYRPVLLGGALCLALSAWFSARIPSQPLRPEGRNPFRAMTWVWRDRSFGWVILAWSLMGFANLAASPLRAEWLANPAYGLSWRPDTITLVLVGLPALVRILFLPVWGRLYDQIDFLRVRALINVVWGLAMAVFFLPWWPCQFAGAVLFGIGMAGGDIAWNLWVNRYAPPERAADYMGVHVCLAGARGLLAPWAAFHLLTSLSPGEVVRICAGLVLLSTAMLFYQPRTGAGEWPAGASPS